MQPNNNSLPNIEAAILSLVEATKLSHSGNVLQVVSFQTGATATGTTTVPFDNTPPQKTEGVQYMSLAITPKSATSVLVIEVIALLYSGSSGGNIMLALFQDDIASAIAASHFQLGTNIGFPCPMRHTMLAGSEATTTFKFRAGHQVGGTVTFNGIGGSPYLGGLPASSITITEYAA